MTKKQKIILLTSLVLGLSAIVWFKFDDLFLIIRPKPIRIDVAALKINGRKVTGLTKGKEAEELRTLKIANEVSPEWRKEVVKAVLAQGGTSVKKILVEKVESLIWNQNGQGINVESVIIRLTDKNNEETSFRAMVNSETGKILQNWDQPVNDPINPRDNFGVKLDPRYHND